MPLLIPDSSPSLLHNNELLSDSRVDRGKAFSTLGWREGESGKEREEKIQAKEG